MPENLNFKDLQGKDAPGPLYRELRGPSLEVRISHPFSKTMYLPHFLEIQSIFLCNTAEDIKSDQSVFEYRIL